MGNHPSPVWRAIVEGKDVLKQGLIRRIGNGTTTNIWNDNWLPRKEMMRPIVPLIQDPPSLVAEVIDSTSATWNAVLIHQVFLPCDAEAILQIPLSTRNIEDFWSWNFEKNGHFIVRTTYRMIIATKKRREEWLEETAGASNTSSVEQSWVCMWRTSVPGKIRVFLWRLAHQSLPTEDVRHHRNMSVTCTCAICGMEDSWKHSLVECSMARCVWALVDQDLLDKMIENREPNARNWIFSMIDLLPHDIFIRLVVTLWAIWSARRKLLHEGRNQSPLSTHLFVTRFIGDLEQLKEPGQPR